jgi:hypothetical protein
MYVRMLSYESEPKHKADVLKVIDKIVPQIKALDGCKDAMFITHDETRGALLVFWDTKEHAEAAAGIIGPQLLPVIGKIAKNPVMPLLYEVYEPAV